MKMMRNLLKQYEIAKRNLKTCMKNGQINAYLNALLEMNTDKKLMDVVATENRFLSSISPKMKVSNLWF